MENVRIDFNKKDFSLTKDKIFFYNAFLNKKGEHFITLNYYLIRHNNFYIIEFIGDKNKKLTIKLLQLIAKKLEKKIEKHGINNVYSEEFPIQYVVLIDNLLKKIINPSAEEILNSKSKSSKIYLVMKNKKIFENLLKLNIFINEETLISKCDLYDKDEIVKDFITTKDIFKLNSLMVETEGLVNLKMSREEEIEEMKIPFMNRDDIIILCKQLNLIPAVIQILEKEIELIWKRGKF